MEAIGRKLKKLRTKQVYGFKKYPFSGGEGGGGGNGDLTMTTLTTLTHVVSNSEL